MIIQKLKIKDKKFNMLYLFLVLISIIILIFVNNNYSFYKKEIAKVVSVIENKTYDAEDLTGKKEIIYNQKIDAIIMNGQHKNQHILLDNTASYTGAYDNRYKIGDNIFVSISGTTDNNGFYSGIIEDAKRDNYVCLMIIVFTLLIVLVGKDKGFMSIISLIINILIFTFAIDFYLKGFNLMLVASIASFMFIIISLLLVSGYNKKTKAAIVGTLISTIISIAIALIVFKLCNSEGIRYEEMQFLTEPPYEIFMAEILIGSLGAIMDIAITMSSSIYELYSKNPQIENHKLIKSGLEIGKDIMGTMTNLLFFVYISGSIPMIILWLKNGMMINYVINVNLSLEMIRALTGSIGIVISIPITLYATIFFIKRSRISEGSI